MTGLERQYLRECVKALVKARDALLGLDCERAIARMGDGGYGKSDTLGLDAAPEAALIRSLCEEFDPHLPFVTEETGNEVHLRGTEEEVVCFSDPMDRSKVLARFLSGRSGRLAEVFASSETIPEWEETCGGDISLTGPYGSVTATRHHHILFNVMINYLTGYIYIACDTAMGSIHLAEAYEDEQRTRLKRTSEFLCSLRPVEFPVSGKWHSGGGLRFVTYCKGQKYDDNLLASDVTQLKSLEEIRESRLVFDEPGGPARVLYLTGDGIGFILSNGEKVGEWIGWLAWVAHSSARLRAYEITFDSSWTRDEILMAPGQAYTVLGDNVIHDRGRRFKAVQLNLQKLRFLRNPSQYRSTLLVCPARNEEVRATLIHERCIELRFDLPGRLGSL
jgi:hypothetical protein